MRSVFYGLCLCIFLINGCAQHNDNLGNTGSTAANSDELANGKEATVLNFETVASGQDSGFAVDENALSQPTIFAIKSQAELEAFWNKHAMIFEPRPAAPIVNFETDMLLALVDKLEPNTGYNIRIDQLSSTGGQIAVAAVRDVPGPAIMAGDALSVPYHIVKTAQLNLPCKLNLRDNVYND